MAKNESGVPLKNRIVAWVCSAAVGLSLYYIFATLFTVQGQMSTAYKIPAVIIGLVAGGGCFALISVNWLKGGGAEQHAVKTVLNPEAYEQLREAAAGWLGRMADPTSETVLSALDTASKGNSETVSKAARVALQKLKDRRHTRRQPGSDDFSRLLRALAEAYGMEEAHILGNVKRVGV